MRLTRRAAIIGAIVAPVAALLKKDEQKGYATSGLIQRVDEGGKGYNPLYTKECQFQFSDEPCTFTTNESERYAFGFSVEDQSRTLEACAAKFDNTPLYRGRPHV